MFGKFSTPRFKDGVSPSPSPDIREILSTPDPELWEGVRQHAAEVGVTALVIADEAEKPLMVIPLNEVGDPK